MDEIADILPVQLEALLGDRQSVDNLLILSTELQDSLNLEPLIVGNGDGLDLLELDSHLLVGHYVAKVSHCHSFEGGNEDLALVGDETVDLSLAAVFGCEEANIDSLRLSLVPGHWVHLLLLDDLVAHMLVLVHEFGDFNEEFINNEIDSRMCYIFYRNLYRR